MDLELKCPKCNHPMEQGFVADHLNGMTSGMARWQRGTPKRNFLGAGIRSMFGAGVPIGAFRCIDCGYLEFYAWNEFGK